MKYGEIVSSVCGENWRTVNQEECEGGYGVACLLAFMKGADANAESLARHLGVAVEDIQASYSRLLRSGLFSEDFDAKHDKWLLGKCSNRQSECAWGHVAGIAAGLIYRSFGRPVN